MQLHHVLALAAVSLVAVSDAQQQPEFDFHRSENFFLSQTSVWEVGSPTRLAILMADDTSGKEIVVKLKGGSCTDRRTVFMYKCAGNSAFKKTVLTTVAVNEDVALCEDEENMPLYLAKSNTEGTTYRTKVKKRKSARYSNAFKDKVELKVMVECKEATLMSNSLIVMNLDTLSQINAVSISRDYLQDFTRRFLTEDAVKFLITMKMPPSQEFATVDFIDPSIVNLIRNSPDFFKAKIGIGAFIPMTGYKCGDVVAVKTHSLYFGSYQSVLHGKTFDMLKFMHLDLDNGNLTYSIYGLSKALSKFVKQTNIITNMRPICGRITIDGDYTVYLDRSIVKMNRELDRNVYKQYGSRNSNCMRVAPTGSKKVTLFSGAQKSYLTCPIVCSEATTQFSFSRKGMTIAYNGQQPFYVARDGLEIHRNGNILRFPSVLTKSHAGVYKCEAGTASFQFDVSVVSLPYFSRDAGLPKSVFAVEGETVSYSCTASFTNIDSVTVKPEFYTNHAMRYGRKWMKVDMYEFNRILKVYGGNAVTMQSNRTNESQTLTVTLTSVTRELSHRFVCNASVPKAAAANTGLSHYTAESSSNVFFIPRPNKSSFAVSADSACGSVQLPCSSGKLSVRLSASLSQYLRSIRVQVRAHFVLMSNSSPLLHLPVNDDVINSAFDADTNLLTADISAGDKKLKWLQQYTYLAPVFQFWFGGDQGSLGGLRLHKGKYGVSQHRLSCLNWRSGRCFYSTEFDANGSLASLGFHLQYNATPPAAMRYAAAIAASTDTQHSAHTAPTAAAAAAVAAALGKI